MKTTRSFPALLAAGLVIGLALPAQLGAVQRSGENVRRPLNMDIRQGAAVTAVAGQDAARTEQAARKQRAALAQGIAALRAKVPDAEVMLSDVTGAAEVIGAKGALTGAAPGKPAVEIVREFIAGNAALYGLNAQEIADLAVLGESASRTSGLRMVRVEQRVNGRPVFQSETRFTLSREGRLARSVGLMVPNASAGALPLEGLLSAPQALVSALASVGIEVAATKASLANVAADGFSAEIAVADAPLRGPATGKVVYFPAAPGVLVPAWSLVVFSTEADWYMLVDARDGTLLWRKNIRNNASTEQARFDVYVQADGKTPADNPAPHSPTTVTPGSGTQFPEIARTTVNMLTVQDITASPNGWVPDGSNTTTGNNVDAYLDRNSNNVPDPGTLENNGRPVGNLDAFARNRDFLGTNYVYTPPPSAGNPEAGTAITDLQLQRGVATQLFYVSNWYHDQLYALGFDEGAANFQLDNFGLGGVGNDRVLAEVQDAAGNTATSSNRNNANFATPPDGTSGRMQMYIFNFPTVDRDGSLDTEIVIHELTHGTSNRLVGNAAGLQWQIGQGMGEGWSDFYALALLNSTPSDNPNARYAAGAYATYKLGGLLDNYLYGIRRFPYSTDNAVNPLTWADVDDTTYDLSGGIATSPLNFSAAGAAEVHNSGEIWCNTLWEVRSRIIADPAGANGNIPAGNLTTLALITDAMKMTPLNPTFIEARDAIFAADAATNANANEASIWGGFADRGLGYGASAPVSRAFGYTAGHTGIVESFSLPYLDLLSTSINDAAGNNNGAIDPGETVQLTVTLKNPWRHASKSVASATATLTALTPGVTVSDGNSTYPAILAQGSAAGDTFTFTVPLGATAGQGLHFTVTPTSALGSQPFTVLLRVGTPAGPGAPVTYTRVVPGGLAIPANTPRGAVDAFVIPDDLVIADLNFRIDNATHTAAGELSFMLKGPTGHGTDLVSLIGGLTDGGSGDNIVNFTADDQAVGDMVTLAAASPYTGTFRPVFNSPSLNSALGTIDPVGNLSRFNGTSAAGLWRVLAADQYNATTGTLTSWSLIVTPMTYTVAPVVPVVNVTGTQTVGGPFTEGSNALYTVTLTNSGSATQADNPGSEFTEVLPAQLTLVSAGATSGTAVAGGANTVTWNGSLPPGGSVTIGIIASINAGTAGQNVSAQGSIAYDADVNGSNESAGLTDDPGVAGPANPTVFTVAGSGGSPVVTVIHFGNKDGGDAAPGEPVGTTLKKFGAPSINNEGDVAFLADTTSPDGSNRAIFAGSPPTPLVHKGDATPGIAAAVFSGFRDPLYTDSGGVTFLGKAKGDALTSATSSGIWTTEFSGSLELVAQAGTAAPGIPGATLKSFSSVAAAPLPPVMFRPGADAAAARPGKTIRRERKATTSGVVLPQQGCVAFVAKLVVDDVVVTKDNDVAVWMDDGNGPKLVLREGQAFDGSTIKSFKLLVARSGAPGQGHGVVGIEEGPEIGFYAAGHAKLADGRQAWIFPYLADGIADIYITAVSGDLAPDYVGATFKSFGVPGQNSFAAGATVAKVTDGDAESASDAALFYEDSDTFDVLRGPTEGNAATGIAGASFSTFGNPLNAFIGGFDILAFVAKCKGGGVDSPNDQGVWWGHAAGTPSLVAREGAEPPGVTGGAFKQFKSLALPEEGAPLFYAKLVQGVGGVTKNDDEGLWGLDSAATLRLLLREGATLTAGGSPRTIKKISALGPVSGSTAQLRAHNDDRQLLARVQFTDGSQALVLVQGN